MGLLDIPGYVRGIFNSTAPTLTNGSRSELQLDASGNLLVNPGALNSVNDSVSSYGAAVSVPFSTTTVQAVASTDAGAYAWVSVHMTSQGTGSSAVFQTSDDNVNWRQLYLSDSQAVNTAGASSLTVSNVMLHGPLPGRYFRISVGGITAGTTAGTVTFFTAARVLPVSTVLSASDYPVNYTAVTGQSGVVSNATASASLPAVGGKTAYVSGFSVTGTGASSPTAVTVTLSGLITGSLQYIIVAASSPTVANTPLIVAFHKAIPASGTNVGIQVSCPALGSGNTSNMVNIHGYYQS